MDNIETALINSIVNDTVSSSAAGPNGWVRRKQSPYDELGASGLAHYSGQVYDEWLPELQGERGRRLTRQMVDEDATIGAILFAIEMLCRQVKWDVKPMDESAPAKEQADFVKGCLFDDMENTWPDTLSEILTMLPRGWSFLETVFKPRRGVQRDASASSKFDDGKIGYKKWALRAQDTLYGWLFDEKGTAIALQQMPPPSFKIYTIPLEKGIHFRTSVRKQNPEGRGIFRNAYRSWYFKRNIENIEAIGIERDLAGLPVGRVPGNLFNAAAGSVEGRTFAQWKKIITSIKRDEQEGLLIPSTRDDKGNFLYDISLLSTGGSRSFDTDRIIQRYDQRITIVALADFILLGHTQHSGSFGLGVNKSELFSTALSAWLDSICATINRQAIPKLLEINNYDLKLAPQLTHGKVQEVTLPEMVEFIKSIVGVGVPITEEDVDTMKKLAGLPVGLPGKSKTTAPLAPQKTKTEPGSILQDTSQPKDQPAPKPKSAPDESPKQASESIVPSEADIQASWEWVTELLPAEDGQ